MSLSDTRCSVCWNVDDDPTSGTNCFGMLSRDTGHSRAPAPPHRMTGRMRDIASSMGCAVTVAATRHQLMTFYLSSLDRIESLDDSYFDKTDRPAPLRKQALDRFGAHENSTHRPRLRESKKEAESGVEANDQQRGYVSPIPRLMS
jgi:hypothetical protein